MGKLTQTCRRKRIKCNNRESTASSGYESLLLDSSSSSAIMETGDDCTGPNFLFTQSPLFNLLVLQIIFKFCDDLQDLRSIRLVCRTWREGSLFQWRRQATLKILRSASTRRSDGNTGIPLGNFVKHLISTKPKDLDLKLQSRPFKRIKLKKWNFRFQLGPEFSQFWGIVGPSLDLLHFEKCNFVVEHEDLASLFQGILNEARNLKTLVMTNNSYCDCFGSHLNNIKHLNLRCLELHKFCADMNPFIRCFPFLEDLMIHGGSSSGIDGWVTSSSFRDGIKLERHHNPRQFNLKRLDVLGCNFLSPEVDSEQLKKFLRDDLHFPLEYFGVKISPSKEWLRYSQYCPTYDSRLRAFTEAFGSTMKVFKVFFRPLSAPGCEPSDNFPFGIQLESLKELYMWGNVTSNLHFLKFTPHLELLHISTFCYDKWEEIKTSEPHFPQGERELIKPFLRDLVEHVDTLKFDMTGLRMTHLTYLHIDSSLSFRSVGKLRIWMPGLKSLQIFVESGNMLRKICSLWPNLEELVLLRDSFVDDGAIIGTEGMGLVYLKSLKRFAFDFLCRCNPTSLTELSVYHGFLKMDSLRSISFVADSQLNNKAIRKLKERVPHVNVVQMKRTRSKAECEVHSLNRNPE